MRYLIDTHCLLWHFASPGRLTPEARAALVDPNAELWLSTGSIWEMVIKESLGKLGLSEPVADFVGSRTAALRCKILGIELPHLRALAALPMHHKDPFDRLLVSQAQAEGLILITADNALRAYDVSILWTG